MLRVVSRFRGATGVVVVGMEVLGVMYVKSGQQLLLLARVHGVYPTHNVPKDLGWYRSGDGSIGDPRWFLVREKELAIIREV